MLVRRRMGCRYQAGAFSADDLRKHVVMYRQGNGQVTALEMPAGIVWCRFRRAVSKADRVVCGYHGLKYNSSGRCTFMPSQENHQSVGMRTRLSCRRASPVRLVMDRRSRNGRPGAGSGHALERRSRPGPENGKTIHVKCDYRLVVDNLMD